MDPCIVPGPQGPWDVARSSEGFLLFQGFAKYMEQRTEQMFAQCIGPVLQSLRDSLTDNQDRLEGPPQRCRLYQATQYIWAIKLGVSRAGIAA